MTVSEIPDPLVDEVRSIRKKISEQFGNDVDRLCEHLESIEEKAMELGSGRADPEVLNSIFRAAHSISSSPRARSSVLTLHRARI